MTPRACKNKPMQNIKGTKLQKSKARMERAENRKKERGKKGKHHGIKIRSLAKESPG